MATQSPIIKQGGTLLLHGLLTQDDGVPVDVTSVQISCQLNDTSGNLVAQLPATATFPTAGMFDISAASALTAFWPVGRLAGDVIYVQGGTVIFSDTFTLIVQPSITAVPPAGSTFP